MSGTRLTKLIALATLIASGSYVFVYLVRWEWSRALISGLIFLAAEVGLVGANIVTRLERLERQSDAAADDRLTAIRAARPTPRRPFAWLHDGADRTSVFIPILLGAGVLVSTVAWVIEHVARVTVTPAMERDLASRLDSLAWPEGGLLGVGSDEDLELLRGPVVGDAVT